MWNACVPLHKKDKKQHDLEPVLEDTDASPKQRRLFKIVSFQNLY